MMTGLANEKRGRGWARPFERRSGWLLGLASLPALAWIFTFLADRFLFAELAVNFQVQLLVLMGLMAALQILIAPRFWPSWLLLIPACWSALQLAPEFAKRPVRAESGSPALRVMSFNLLASNIQFVNVAEEIQRHDPDVLVALEFSQNWERMLAPLSRAYPHAIREARWHGFGIAIFSKYPLHDSRVLQAAPLSSDLPILVTAVETPRGKVHLMAVHFVSPTGSRRLALRNRQFEFVRKQLEAIPEPRLVAGDLNCTPWSPTMQRFLELSRLRDSRSGFGIQASWRPAGMALLAIPIDHVLVSPQVQIHNRFLGRSSGSDHRPVIADVSW